MSTKLNINAIEDGSITIDKLDSSIADKINQSESNSGLGYEYNSFETNTNEFGAVSLDSPNEYEGDFLDISNYMGISKISGDNKFLMEVSTLSDENGVFYKLNISDEGYNLEMSNGEIITDMTIKSPKVYTEHILSSSGYPVLDLNSAAFLLPSRNGELSLGNYENYFNNVYAKKFITENGSSNQLVSGNGSLIDINQIAQYAAASITAVTADDGLDEVDLAVYLKYVPQTLSDTQKAQARSNIDAASVNDQPTVDLSNYYTKEEIDNQLGDLNSILESIINGGSDVIGE